MVRPPSQDALWEAVTSRNEGILATIGETGLPHLSNVYYVADAERRLVRVSTTGVRAKGRNLLRDPRAVLHVPGGDFFNFAVAEGEVTLAVPSAPGDEATDELYAVHSVFNGAAERPAFDHQMLEASRMVMRLEVNRLYGLLHRA
ncbi:TIGR03618 family F420-dependent PPOX class oxidoreductase [Frankia sp. Mgl5]|nr:TIGR03618 family F420-dependent PPOX class oxidoreductase [Frankia sp. Mgl5]